MKLWALLTFFLCCVFYSAAQSTELDSVEISLRKKTISDALSREHGKLHDSIIADYYLQLADFASGDYDYKLAISYCDSIIAHSDNLRFDRLKEVEERKALYLRRNGETGEGIKILLGILQEYESKKDFKRSAELNRKIGTLFLKMNDLANAEFHLKASIADARKAKDREIEGYARMSLGNRFKKVNRFDEAKEQYMKSIAIAEEIENQRMLAGNYNHYGSLLNKQQKLTEARKFYLKAAEINKSSGNQKWLSYNYNNLGNISNKEHKYQEALNYFLLSIEMKEELGDFRGKVQTLTNVAEAYKNLGNYKEAFNYQRLFVDLSDSVAKLDNIIENKRLAAQFQSEKREARIRELNIQDSLNQQKIANQNEKLSYQTMIASILGIGVLLVIIIAFVLWRSSVNRKRINAELVEKNEQIDRQHREILDSINYASRIQNSILPGNEQRKRLLPDHAILFKPKDIISGDFYLCDNAGDKVFFGTVDCTGHGVPGAMVSLVASSHINKTIHEYELTDPGEILTRLNDEIPSALNGSDESINDGMDMSLCALNLGAMTMEFAGAYQNCWILASIESLEQRDTSALNARVHADQDKGFGLLEVKGERRGIGRSTISHPFTSQSIELAKGDVIILTSDGYQDQFGGPRNKKFKVRELRKLVLTLAGSSPDQIVNTLDTTLKEWMDRTDQIDDVCVFAVRV